MVLKSAFLLAVSASLVLTTQAALNMRDTPLYKRNSAVKEINKALLDQKVADCVAKSIGLGEDKASSKYVEQVLACVNVANAPSGAQGQAMDTPPGAPPRAPPRTFPQVHHAPARAPPPGTPPGAPPGAAEFVGNEMGNKALKPSLR